jgi:hypothetical protein
MTSAIRNCLIELGVHDAVPRGRACIYNTPEEAAVAQREQQRLALQAQRQAKREARLAGLPEPSFRRGRRRVYATKEESIAAKRASDNLSKQRQTQRVIDATRLLAAQSDNSSAPVRSPVESPQPI